MLWKIYYYIFLASFLFGFMGILVKLQTLNLWAGMTIFFDVLSITALYSYIFHHSLAPQKVWSVFLILLIVNQLFGITKIFLSINKLTIEMFFLIVFIILFYLPIYYALYQLGFSKKSPSKKRKK